MTYTVYTYGGGEAVYEALNAVAAMMGGPDYLGLIKVFMVLGLFWVVIEMGLHQTINWHWIVMFMLMFNIFFVPKENVVIVDRFNPANTRVVANVPFGLAAPAWFFSLVGDGLTRLAEASFSQPGDLQYENTGMVFGSKLLTSINNARFDNPRLNSNLTMYAKQCVFMNIAYGFYTVSKVYQSNNLVSLLLSTTHNSNLRGMFYDLGNGQSPYKTCTNAARQLRQDMTPVVNGMIGRFANMFFAHSSQGSARNRARLLATLPVSYGYLAGISTTAQQMVTQAAMANYFENSYGQVAAMNGAAAAATAWSTAVAGRQQLSSYRTMGQLAAKSLPQFQSVFRVMIYSSFFIVFLALMLPITVSGKALKIYLQMFLWIELWPVFYAVVNMVSNIYAKEATRAALDPSLGITSMAGLYGMSAVNSEIGIIAGYMALSVPVFAWIVASGSAQALSAVSTGLFAPAIQAANQAGSEVSRGNISAGNMSAGNESIMQGQSAPNMNTVGTLTNAFGTTKVGRDGRTVITQSMSQLGVTAEASRNVEHSVQASLGNATSAATHDATSVSHAHTQEATAAQDFVSSTFSGQNDDMKKAVSNITGDSHTFNSSTSVADEFAKKTGLTTQQSTAVLGYARTHVGGDLGPIGGAEAGAEITGTSKAQFSHAMDVAQKAGYADKYDDAVKQEHALSDLASRDHVAGSTATAADRLAESDSQRVASENKFSADLSKVKTLQNTESFLTSNSQSAKLNLGQAVKDFADEEGMNTMAMTPKDLGRLAAATGTEKFEEFVVSRFGDKDLYANTHIAGGGDKGSDAVLASFGKETGLGNAEVKDIFEHAGEKGHTFSPSQQAAMDSKDFTTAQTAYNHVKGEETRLNPDNITHQHQTDTNEVPTHAAPPPTVHVKEAQKTVGDGTVEGVTGKLASGASQETQDNNTLKKGQGHTESVAGTRKQEVSSTPTDTLNPTLEGSRSAFSKLPATVGHVAKDFMEDATSSHPFSNNSALETLGAGDEAGDKNPPEYKNGVDKDGLPPP